MCRPCGIWHVDILIMHICLSASWPGIDVCGQRLAVEVQQLVSNTPSLTAISFIGHSMGGLIARYAIGLLSDPTTGTVAGLQAGCYVSIASPHLGCSSSHPEEVGMGKMLSRAVQCRLQVLHMCTAHAKHYFLSTT